MAKFKAIIFDFDGVILESADIKTKAFASLFSNYPEHVEEIVRLHLCYAGVSRFEKFEMIYRDILKQPLSQEKKTELGQEFTNYVYQQIIACPFVEGAQEFLEKYHQKTLLFVASGTPDAEIKSIVRERGLDKYFKMVYGSPLKKKDIALKIIKEFNLNPKDIVFIGDAIEDYQGAKEAEMAFVGRITNNNPFKNLKVEGIINNLTELEKII